MAVSIVQRSVQVPGANRRGTLKPFSTDVTFLAADTATNLELTPARTGFRAVLTFAGFSVTTDSAQTLAIQDGAALPMATFKSSPGLGLTAFTFGEDGIRGGADQLLRFSLSAAGLAGFLHVEGYYEQVAPLTPAQLAAV